LIQQYVDDLLVEVRNDRVDVAIVDIRLPPTHNDEGLRAALEIRADHPAVGVLVLLTAYTGLVDWTVD
jgi:DNA-binding NarL/FixJ family response regulator